jgi:hypothetical protein
MFTSIHAFNRRKLTHGVATMLPANTLHYTRKQ